MFIYSPFVGVHIRHVRLLLMRPRLHTTLQQLAVCVLLVSVHLIALTCASVVGAHSLPSSGAYVLGSSLRRRLRYVTLRYVGTSGAG